MLARPVSDQVWKAPYDERPYDHERHVAALHALPGSCERERTTKTTARRHDNARKQARRAASGKAAQSTAQLAPRRPGPLRAAVHGPVLIVSIVRHRARVG